MAQEQTLKIVICGNSISFETPEGKRYFKNFKSFVEVVSRGYSILKQKEEIEAEGGHSKNYRVYTCALQSA